MPTPPNQKKFSWDCLPANRLLDPLLNTRLPDGVGMTFDEEKPENAVACSFRLT